MGGLFKVSSPKSTYSPAPAPVAATPAPAPTPVIPASQPVDPQAQASERRVEAMTKESRGKSGLIVTSDRGLLSPSGWVPQRKSLLGE